ncbi:MAG: PDZ domain-containing protein, partial [Patescibacteria group bacterium]
NVIGIKSAVATGAENVGFALPINLLKRDLASIQSSGRIIYPYLGVRYTDITADIARSRGLTVTEGALVLGTAGDPGVIPNSPAAKSGIKEGDIIRTFHGVAVNSEHRLSDLIQARAPGDAVSIVLLRGTETLTIRAILTEFQQ